MPRGNAKKPLTVRLPVELVETIITMAALEAVSQADVVERLVVRGLDAEGDDERRTRGDSANAD